jgi:hypothetical protein
VSGLVGAAQPEKENIMLSVRKQSKKADTRKETSKGQVVEMKSWAANAGPQPEPKSPLPKQHQQRPVECSMIFEVTSCRRRKP